MKNSSFSEEQIDLLTQELARSFKPEDFVTKQDIKDFATKQDLAEMELRLIKWQIGGIGLMIAVVKFL